MPLIADAHEKIIAIINYAKDAHAWNPNRLHDVTDGVAYHPFGDLTSRMRSRQLQELHIRIEVGAIAYGVHIALASIIKELANILQLHRCGMASLGLGFDAVNSNTFQDQPGQKLSYKFGSLTHADPAVRAQIERHQARLG